MQKSIKPSREGNNAEKRKKESTTIKTNITAIDKKYLVENFVRDLNICSVDRSNYCLEGCSIR
jgi:hypothetical protein